MGGKEASNSKDQEFSIFDLPDVPMGILPPHIQLQKTRVVCNEDAPLNYPFHFLLNLDIPFISFCIKQISYSGAYASMGVDNSLQLQSFCNDFKVDVIRLTDEDMEFDLIGIDPAIANAFRRILIAEVPTMAIEKVLIANNTSVVQDEVLSHRLGLIPIEVDPRLFEYLSENDKPNEKNTIVFKLHVKCKRGSPRISGSELLKEQSVQNQDASSKPEMFNQDNWPEFANKLICPKYGDIILAKLSSGQEIELEAHAVKGVGKTHAKWSPVATAWYRMLPEVILLEEVDNEMAEKLKANCPVGVFDIEDVGNGKKRATVARPRACTLCRECIREDEGGEKFEKLVELRRAKNHFIFTIELTGALPPEVLFTEAVKILEDNAAAYIPLTVLAVPASVLTLGGGYLFGLPVGIVADSIGATVGAGAAFVLGKTIGKPFVVSKLKDYPKFRSVAIAIDKSGFKIVLLLRLVPMLPFNILNYLLSVTPVPVGEYMLASWIGMMPITIALVYMGTTLKDLSDVTKWDEFSKSRLGFLILGLVISVILMICVTKVAKDALEKALAENEDIDGLESSPPELLLVVEAPEDLHQPLLIKIDTWEDDHER
ncbi:hypothetical protein ACFE04_004933 [Oxalis oulophora]